MNGLVWFRRDLRVNDHFALSQALQACQHVWCVFVFDTEILDALPSRSDRRVEFIQGALEELHANLGKLSPAGHLIVLQGPAREAIPWLAQQLHCQTVYINRDFEPSAIDRDQEVERSLKSSGIGLEQFLDHVIFPPEALRTAAGSGYTVFSPYRNAWLKRLTSSHLTSHPVLPFSAALAPWPTELRATPENLHGPWRGPPSLAAIGFEPTNLKVLGIQPGEAAAQALLESFVQRIGDYRRHRDFPAIRGPSYLSVHLRFGTISIRQLVQTALHIQQTDAKRQTAPQVG